MGDRVRLVVGWRAPAGAAVDPHGAEVEIARGGQVEVRAGADVDKLVPGHAEGSPGMFENLPRRLVGLRLLGGDDPVDRPAELRDVAGDDGVIGIGDDRQPEAGIL